MGYVVNEPSDESESREARRLEEDLDIEKNLVGVKILLMLEDGFIRDLEIEEGLKGWFEEGAKRRVRLTLGWIEWNKEDMLLQELIYPKWILIICQTLL